MSSSIDHIMNDSTVILQKWLALLTYSPLISLYNLNVHVSTRINENMQKNLDTKTRVTERYRLFHAVRLFLSTGQAEVVF